MDAVQIQTLPMLLCKQGPGVSHYSTKSYYASLMQHKGMQVACVIVLHSS